MKKIAYWPHSQSLKSPGDRRRFIFYAESREILYEIYNPSKSYDLVYFSQSADITQYKEIKNQGTKIIYDRNNSYFSDNSSIKGIFRNPAKFIARQNKYLVGNYANYLKYEFLPNIDGVACGSQEYVEALQKFSGNVHRIPDHSHNEIIETKLDYNNVDDQRIHIAWKGLGSNLYQLNQLKDVFHEFSLTHEFVLPVISENSFFKYMNRYIKTDSSKVIHNLCKNIIIHEWDDNTYSSIITKCDFAIIPVNENSPTAKMKPENKLINLWKMGMPVITSPIDSYKRVMSESRIDCLCSSDSDWLEKFKQLSNSSKLRKNIGMQAKEYTQNNYSKDIVLNQWDEIFNSIEY